MAVPGVQELETLRLAMRGARLGTWVRDLLTDEVTWSPELEDLFGMAPGTMRPSRAAVTGSADSWIVHRSLTNQRCTN